MKPLPLISLDALGCVLWSALLIEVVFLFNYGEYYNWWDGRPFRVVTFMVPVTFYFALQRMRHIRHPYIAPRHGSTSVCCPCLLCLRWLNLSTQP